MLVSEHLRQNITATAPTEGVELTPLRGISAFPRTAWWHVHCLVLAHVSISKLCLELNSALSQKLGIPPTVVGGWFEFQPTRLD